MAYPQKGVLRDGRLPPKGGAPPPCRSGTMSRTRPSRTKNHSFFHLGVEVVEYPQVGTGIGKAKLNILFQIGLIAKEAAAGPLEFGDNKNGIANGAHREKILLPGDGSPNRAHGAPGAAGEDAEEGFFVTHLIGPIALQES